MKEKQPKTREKFLLLRVWDFVLQNLSIHADNIEKFLRDLNEKSSAQDHPDFAKGGLNDDELAQILSKILCKRKKRADRQFTSNIRNLSELMSGGNGLFMKSKHRWRKDGQKMNAAEFKTQAISLIREKHQREIHPYGMVFPILKPDEITNLGLNLQDRHLPVEVTVYEGKILDGKNLLLAADEFHIPISFVEYQGEDPLKFVFSQNLHRRHLKDSQRAIIGAKLVTTERGSNQHPAIAGSTHTSQEHAAAMVRLSVATIARAQKVLEGGNQEIIDAVTDGRMSVNGALNALKRLCQAKEPNAEVFDEKRVIAVVKRLHFSEQLTTKYIEFLRLNGESDPNRFIAIALEDFLDAQTKDT